MVRQPERGDEPPPRRLLPRLTPDSRNMQHVSGHVLQEHFEQGESQEEESPGRGQASRRRYSGDGGTSEASETSLSLTPENSAHVTTSSQASFFTEAARHSRLSRRPEIPRRRSGRTSETHSAAQTPFALSPPVGPAARPRAVPSPPWTPASATLSSQLVGGGVEGDADIVVTPDVTDVTPNQSPTYELSRLSPGWTSRIDIHSPTLPVETVHDTPIATPQSAGSSASEPTQSFLSDRSDASSFAYRLRNNRADHRLFHKKNRPLAHRHKHPAPLKRPPSVRSASFYKPKVVEDSAVKAQHVVPKATGPSPPKSPPTAPSTQSSRTVLRQDRSSQSQSQSHSGSSREMSLSPPPAEGRGHRARSPPAHINIPAPVRHARFDTSPGPQPHDRDTTPHVPSVALSPRASAPAINPKITPQRRHRRPTPPNADPQTPFDRLPGHGEHYFRMFGPDTIYEKPIPETFASDKLQRVHTQKLPEVEHAPPAVETSAVHTGSHVKRHALRHSVFQMFHGSQKVDEAEHKGGEPVEALSPVHSPSSSKPGTPHPFRSPKWSPATPGSISSYFPTSKRRHQNKSSGDNRGTPPFGLATNWEDVVSESQPSAQVRPESAPMSPLSMPPIRPRPKRNDERMDVSQAAKQSSPDNVNSSVLSAAAVSPQSKYKSAIGEEHYRTKLTGPGAPSFLPSEMKRVNTPPVENAQTTANKPSGFKGFFFDMRSIPNDRKSIESESPVPSKLKQRAPIIAKTSLQSLLPKVSLQKLKRKASRVPKQSEPPKDTLAVTEFEQTPFSQRYGDTRRAKMSRIRAYVDETLKESENDDDDDGAALFVLDVPEHLPTSPLCPLSPKHPSGGKAICPTHRRKRTTFGASSPGIKASQQLGTQSPTLVFEGNYFADGRRNDGAFDHRRMPRSY